MSLWMWAEAYEHDERVHARKSDAHAVTRLYLRRKPAGTPFLLLPPQTELLAFGGYADRATIVFAQIGFFWMCRFEKTSTHICSTAENLEMHRGRRAVLKQHIDHLLHNGFGVHIDGTRRRLARHRHGRMIRKGTERIGKGFEVGVMGGEHGDEKQSDGAGAHAKCPRVRQTCETRKSELRANEWIVSFFID